MSIKRFYAYLFLISVLVWLPCYGADPRMIKLDLNNTANNDDANTQVSYTKFIISDSGKEVNDVSIYLDGDIHSLRRPNPSGMWYEGVYYPRAGERIYRDFIYSDWPNGITITLLGLGANRDCNVTVYAFDANVTESARIANWYANGTYLLDTNFIGGASNWPGYEDGSPGDLYKWAFSGTATTDSLGRIILTSSRDPLSPSGEPFAYVNALVVEPEGAYVPTLYAWCPLPLDGGEDVSANTNLTWKAGGSAATHDVYFGTDEGKVTDANRSNPMGVLVSQGQGGTSYNPPKLLDLDTTYYWRVDEVNSAPDYTIFKGEVWSFRTGQQFVMEDFDSYVDNAALRAVWEKGGTSAEVSVEPAVVREGNSMKYRYRNNLPPYYSEAYVDMVDLGIDDPNWLGIGAYALVLYFYGEPTNPLSEQMYVRLTDGDSPAKTSTVTYNNTNDLRLKQWNKWSIALSEFTDVNLANVSRITIGFGDGSAGNAGVVYVEDIQLDYTTGEIYPVSGEVDVNVVYQELEGFGAAAGWHEFEISSMPEAKREEIYDAVFNELGLDIYRTRNTYDYDEGFLDRSAAIIVAGKARNPSLKVLICSWSPPPYLKSNDKLERGTLKKDAYDNYMYDEFAQWWADSLEDWGNHGVVADYISMQNETDFETDWATCRFNTTENPSYAGYDIAFEAVYQEIYSRMGSNMPKMLAPETAGFNNLSAYINALIDRNHVYGYAHHLYNGGGNYAYPDGYITNMNYYRTTYGYKPLMMTEFSKGGVGDVTTFTEAMNLAHLIHNSMVFENAAAYIYWELFWTPPKGLIMYSNTNIKNPIFYALKHYSAFTDPGWHRVAASTSLGEQGNVRVSAYKSPDNQQLSIVIINLAYQDYNLTLDLNGFSFVGSEIYRTSETERTAYIGPYDTNGSLMLPARSIVTIHCSTALLTCADYLNAGYGLASDLQPDCYVNYEDLKVITDNWLNSECDLLNDCDGADFEPSDGTVNLLDLSRFAEQWLWCNDPDNTNCTATW